MQVDKLRALASQPSAVRAGAQAGGTASSQGNYAQALQIGRAGAARQLANLI